MHRVFMLTIAAAISTVTGTHAQEPLNVVATIGMIGNIAETLGGDCASVATLMGPGIDPHLYQATARDVQTLNTADLILYSGYGLEGQLGEVLARFAERIPTLAVAQSSISPDDVIETSGNYNVDPHLWMDARLWAQTVPAIADQLATLAPACADQIAAEQQILRNQLDALNSWVGEAIATIPEPQRILVTAHDAFAYFGRAYGIEVAGIQGISTQSEAGIADIRETADLLAERAIPAVFVESTINPRTIQSVIEAARDSGHEVSVGGQLFSDAMGEAGTAGGTYIGMIYENTRAITQALGGTPPPLPEALEDWARLWNIQ
jgi:manganese/zinc/iron transport system substrate-binding protein